MGSLFSLKNENADPATFAIWRADGEAPGLRAVRRTAGSAVVESKGCRLGCRRWTDVAGRRCGFLDGRRRRKEAVEVRSIELLSFPVVSADACQPSLFDGLQRTEVYDDVNEHSELLGFVDVQQLSTCPRIDSPVRPASSLRHSLFESHRSSIGRYVL